MVILLPSFLMAAHENEKQLRDAVDMVTTINPIGPLVNACVNEQESPALICPANIAKTLPTEASISAHNGIIQKSLELNQTNMNHDVSYSRARRTHFTSDGSVRERTTVLNKKQPQAGENPGPLGNHVQIKQISPNGYNGPSTQDFIDRADLLTNAMKANCCPPESEEKDDCSLKFKNLNDKTFDRITQEASIEVSNEEAASRNWFQFKRDKFDAKFDIAKAILQDHVNNLQRAMREQCNKDLDKEQMRSIENEYLSSRPRPTLLNQYELPPSEAVNKRFFSLHVPGREDTQTSAARDREGLANFVEASFGVQSNDGQGPVKLLFSGYRHSSYPPISIRDKTTRQFYAIRNAKQMLFKLARNYCNKHNKCPTELPLSSMILLTPNVALDAARAAMEMKNENAPHESEIDQMNESYQALRTFDNQQVEVDDCNGNVCTVTPKITVMNIPANDVETDHKKMTAILAAGKSSDMQPINARGIDNYITRSENFTQNNFCAIESLSKKDKTMPPLAAFKNLNKSIEKLKNNNSKTINEYKKSIAEEEKGLADDYKKLSLYANTDSINTSSGFKAEVKALMQRISEKEARINSIYQKVEEERKKDYLADGPAIRNKEKQLISFYEQKITALKAEKNSPQSSKQVENLGKLIGFYERQKDIMQLNSDAMKVYFNDEYKSWKNRHVFQRNFLLANYLMGSDVEFYCKSAEDRTGRINNKIEEALIFKEKHGRFPSYEKQEDLDEIRSIAPIVHYNSASRETNNVNNPGARGLQIPDDPDLKAAGSLGQMDDKMGKLAKQVYSGSKKKEKEEEEEEEEEWE
ncbi:MAG: hypothetical protein HQK50_14500 [Oligoflexia bacterium]|nr:hypothetical protein [Oligoflexia bacterium]